MNEIILTAKGKLIDKEAREYIDILNTKIETINKRTKNHTIYIHELKKQIKELENEIRQMAKRSSRA